MVKKAVLVGINYRGQGCELRGCISDVAKFHDMLVTSFGYDPNHITCLTDDTKLKPTKSEVLNALSAMVKDVSTGDSLCFFYSGHGTQVRDANNDETSGFDDALYCVDGQLVMDDDLLNILTQLNGSHMMLFFDCCHSGTMCDLRYNLRYKGKSLLNKPQYEVWMETSKNVKGPICMFAGCLDTQTSADSSFPKSNNERESGGAFTHYLLDVIAQKNRNITNRTVLTCLYDKLKSNNYDQIPQFSCSSMKMLDAPFTI